MRADVIAAHHPIGVNPIRPAAGDHQSGSSRSGFLDTCPRCRCWPKPPPPPTWLRAGLGCLRPGQTPAAGRMGARVHLIWMMRMYDIASRLGCGRTNALGVLTAVAWHERAAWAVAPEQGQTEEVD